VTVLKLYNTLTRIKEEFRPLDPANVRVYVCGPTVYDFAHIGNARPVIVFDVLYRLLRHLYPGEGRVKYVRNITDVDDKINARAAEEYPALPLNEAIRQVTEKTERQFHEDVAALGCLKPDVEPRATEHIEEMKVLIERLVANGCAYVAEGHVLFHVAAMKDYGKLANRSLDEMIAGARVEVAPYKRDAMDFVLWKPSKSGEPGWPSPAGIKAPGRPGWHIECSAMSWKHLGEQFDIHGGGIDLVFPHHENELAQSRCAFHSDRMAQVWMHNGFLQVEGAKMSKSLGNFLVIRGLLNKWPGDILRMQMLMTHYRQPIDWSETKSQLALFELGDWAHAVGAYYGRVVSEPSEELLVALSDDLNTPAAITVLRDLYKQAKNGSLDVRKKFAAACKFMGFKSLHKPGAFQFGVTGINFDGSLFDNEDQVVRLRAAIANDEPEEVRAKILEQIEVGDTAVEVAENGTVVLGSKKHKFGERVEQLIGQRKAARRLKRFEESDRIRDELAAMGIVLKDNKDGTTTWEVAR
jgi:cysteinyl-tRNA synthetase